MKVSKGRSRRREKEPVRITSKCLVVFAVLVLGAGCGSDYRPSSTTPSGRDAAPLGVQWDIDVDLPNLTISPSGRNGVLLQIEVSTDRGGDGLHDARVQYLAAQAGGASAQVVEHSTGKTEVLVDGEDWSTRRIGPIAIENTSFEYTLIGRRLPDDSVSGRSLESLTSLEGTFSGWRRRRFIVAGSDFLSGGRVSEVSQRRQEVIVARHRLELTSPDAVIRRTASSVYVVNRLGYDNLQRLDPADDFRASWEAGVGPGSNPQDVLELSPSKLYVTRYGASFGDILILRPQGGARRGKIPLSQWAENSDGTPRATRLVEVEGEVFVALQDISKNFTEYAEGKLLVIDPASDLVLNAIPLGGDNPTDLIVRKGADGRSKLWVVLSGVFAGLLPKDLSGGVVVVDARNHALEGVVLDDDDAGGNISGLAVARDDLAYVIVTDENYQNKVLAFNPQSGEVLRTVWQSELYIPEIAIDSSGILAIPDRNYLAPQLCLWRTPATPEGLEEELGCAPQQLPPFSLEALD